MRRLRYLTKLINLIVIASILGTGVGAGSFAESYAEKDDLFTDAEKDWIRQHPVIYYAPDPIFAPVEFIDDSGEVKGISPEYLEWISDHSDLTIETVKYKTWPQILQQVSEGKVDIVTAAKTPGRTENMIFTEQFLELSNTILVREDYPDAVREYDLQSMKTAVLESYAVQDYLEIKYPNIRLTTYDSAEQALKDLSFGSIDALVIDIAQGSHFISRLNLTNLRSAGDIDFNYYLSFGIRQDYAPLAGILDKLLDSMPESEKNRIRSNWISYKVTDQYSQRTILAVLAILLIALLIAGGVLLWNRLLRRQVAIKTEELENELKLRISTQKELMEKNRQITEINNELEITRKELSSLIDLVPYHIFAKDRSGSYSLVNQSFLDFFGLKKEDVIGRRDGDIFESQSAAFLDALSKGHDDVYEDHRPVVIDEIDMWDNGGERHRMRMKKIPYFIWNLKQWGMLGVTIDITDLKNVEFMLEDLNEKLEAKVERRTYLLNETNRELELSMYKLQMKQSQLEEANNLLEDSLISLRDTQNQLIESEKLAALGRLVAGVSHEINTPLGIGITAISYLEKECCDICDAMDAQTLTKREMNDFLSSLQTTTKLVLTNLKNAANLVNKFKQIAVDQSTEELREFDLKEYLDGIIQSLSPQLKHTNFTFSLHCPEGITVLSYPSIVTQIITNLVMNSLSHGFEGLDQGEMVLEVSNLENNMLLLHYYDNGLGISDEHIEKIFEPFFTTKRGKGGIGLGLNIVYNLITRTLNGSVEVRSEKGEGTHFYIHMPVREDASTLFSSKNND